MCAASVASSSLPLSLHSYPFPFSRGGEEDDEGEVRSPLSSSSTHTSIFRDVSLMTALYWLMPLYVLAGWFQRTNPAVAEAIRCIREWGAKKGGGGGGGAEDKPLDVRVSLLLLPLYESFFEEKSRRVPLSDRPYRSVHTFLIPTPKGPKTISREKVEGDESPPRPDFIRVSATTAVNANKELGYFCLWPGHDHFLVHYEDPKEKLQHFTYLELDRLRFAYVAMKELLEAEGTVFHRHDGSVTGLASRDIKKNCKRDAQSPEEAKGSTSSPPPASTVGRGGGNARLHHGTSGNVITAPSQAVVQAKKEAQQKRFLREDLQNLCQVRWPHTPIQKSCVFSIIDQRQQCALEGTEDIGGGGVANINVTNRNGTKRKGPTFYLAAVDLPLYNKKGGNARFKARKWWSVKADAECDAAEVAMEAIQNMK